MLCSVLPVADCVGPVVCCLGRVVCCVGRVACCVGRVLSFYLQLNTEIRPQKPHHRNLATDNRLQNSPLQSYERVSQRIFVICFVIFTVHFLPNILIQVREKAVSVEILMHDS